MTDQIVTKLSLAQRQLETAIGLFLCRVDRISAITLAGAADGILHGLVLKAGKQPFSDYALAMTEAMSNETPKKKAFAKYVNDKFNINDLKHMDEGGLDEMELDIDKSAFGAIIKAIANHHILVPDHPPYIKAMLAWAWNHYDGQTLHEAEPLDKPAGEAALKAYQERSPITRKAEVRFARNWATDAPPEEVKPKNK
ncbi:hypothetical protein PQR14_35425 [Paraburkholderia bryophila]|uniref:hypothetical protein n=1 Tax=Paraburkholderia bryophila TaxID=420952 RepID=UPI0038BD9F51